MGCKYKTKGLFLLVTLSFALLFSIFSVSALTQISTCQQLQNMNLNLNENYELSGDVDCTGFTFSPVGTLGQPFTGNFDGKGRNIINLNINYPGQYVGLFGHASEFGARVVNEIKNVNLVNVNILGNDVVGGIIGGGGWYEVTNCSVTGKVTGTGADVGGILGKETTYYYSANIVNSYFKGDVKGAYNVGGLVGTGSYHIARSYTAGTVTSTVSGNVGGMIGNVVGNGENPVVNSYSKSIISSAGANAGGLFGNTGGLYWMDNSNSYFNGRVDGTSNVGGLIGTENYGFDYPYKTMRSFAKGKVTGSSNTGALIGNSVKYPHIDNTDYFDIYNTGQTTCVGNNATTICLGVNSGNAQPAYFYTITNAPMSSWDFANVWSNVCDGIGTPILRGLAGQDCNEISGGGVATDSDGDGIADNLDNCVDIYNPDQRNADNQGGGDVCDICPDNAADSCNTGGSAGIWVESTEGALVESANIATAGASFSVPAEALLDSRSMSITEVAVPPANVFIGSLKNGVVTPKVAYSFTPDGTVFNQPITITVVNPGGCSIQTSLFVQNSSGDWEKLVTTRTNNGGGSCVYSAQTTHFSKFILGEINLGCDVETSKQLAASLTQSDTYSLQGSDVFEYSRTGISTSEPGAIGRIFNSAVGLFRGIYDSVVGLFSVGITGRAVFSSGLDSGLVSYWNFDGNANDIQDGNSLTMTNGATFASDGKKGQAASFDGINDYAINNPSSGSFSGAFTYSAWVKAGSFVDNAWHSDVIMLNANDPSWNQAIGNMRINYVSGTTGQLQSFCYTAGGWANSGTPSTTLNAGTWYHLVTVSDGSTLKTYVNGVLDSSNSAACVLTNNKFYVGGWNGGQYSNALIDEAGVWNRALSDSEVTSLYDSYNAAPACAAQPSGLVSWWNADTAGNAGKDAKDGNDATLNSGATTAAGKVGNAFSLDGVDDYVVTPSISLPSAFSISVWVNANGVQDAYDRIAETNVNGGFYLGANSAGTGYQFIVNGDFGLAGGAITPGAWQLVTATYDSSTSIASLYVNGVLINTKNSPNPGSSNYPIYIGRYQAGNQALWKGLIDEVQLYNKVLTQAEISAVYNAGNAGVCSSAQAVCMDKPANMVDWWNLDSDAMDSVGISDATISGATAAAGMVSGAYSFDGVNDYISIPGSVVSSTTTDITFATWVNLAMLPPAEFDGKNPTFFSQGVWDGNWHGYLFGTYYGGAYAPTPSLYFRIDHAGGDVLGGIAYPITSAFLNNWHQVVGTCGGGNIKLYVDGVMVKSAPHSCYNFNAGTATSSFIGAGNAASGLMSGKLDELQIYNRALSDSEIQALYASGSNGVCKVPAVPHCGDRRLNQASEQCDDGNTINTDACKNDCTSNVCGDGIVYTDVETCDDGNTLEGDGCSVDCQIEGASCVNMTNGMVSWWGADNSASLGEDMKDGNNLNLFGGVAQSLGKVGHAYSFDGVNDYTTVNGSVLGNAVTDVTISAWVNLALLPPAPFDGKNPTFFSQGNWDGNWHGYVFGTYLGSPYADTPSLYFRIDHAGGDVLGGIAYPITSAFLNNWHQVVGTCGGGSIKLYVDGNLVKSAPHTCQNFNGGNAISSFIGAGNVGAGLMNGKMDELQIYTRELSAAEIKAVYDAKTFGVCRAVPVCGDLVKSPGEVCDGSRACTSGGYPGTQNCNADCTAYDVCVTTDYCGNGVASAVENCDGTDFGQKTCASVLGAGYTGNLACTADCNIITTGCSSGGVSGAVCGNNIIESGEECDGTNLGTATCASVLGAGYTGDLACSDCGLVTTWCVAPQPALCSGLVSMWDADTAGNAGKDTKDGNDLTLSGNAATTTGKVGNAFSFNGGIAKDASVSGLSGLTSMTMSLWIYPTASSSYVNVVGNGAPGSNYPFYIGLLDLVPKVYLGNIDPNWRAANSAIPLNQWSLVTATVGNSQLNIYINGVLSGTYNLGSNNIGNIAYFELGGRSDLPGYQFSGNIDEAQVYNTALSASDIQAIYNAGSTGVCKNGGVSGAVCGDGNVQSGEVCDGNTQACTIGGYPGVQSCNTQCDGFNSCVASDYCGNGIASAVENCDGTDFGQKTCESILGAGYTGTLACTVDCNIINTGCTAPQTGGCTAQPAGMVSWWTGNSDASDSKGTNEGTLVGGAVAGAAGKVSGAFSLDGNDDYVNLNKALTSNGPFAISVWAKTADKSASKGVFELNYGSSNNGLYLLTYNNLIYFGIRSNLQLTVPTSAINNNEWFNYAVVYNGGGLANANSYKIYINGVEQTAGVGGVPGNPNTVNYIGRIYDNGWNWNGAIDELQVYNTALSASEVSAIYNAGSNGVCSGTGGTGGGNLSAGTCETLVSRWKFDGNVLDSTDGNSGISNGGVTYIAGKYNQSASLNGGARIDLGTRSNLFAANPSISFWAKGSCSNFQVIYDTRTSGTTSGTLIACNGNNVVLYASSTGSSWESSGTVIGTISSTDWNQYAISCDGTSCKTYLNGVLANSVSIGNIYYTGNHAYIGNYYGNDLGFTGALDEFTIWNKALTASEVGVVYTAAVEGQEPCGGTGGTGGTAVCGNGITEAGEYCDSDSGTCMASNGYRGVNTCNASCSGYTTCEPIDYCGDGVMNGNGIETCDENDFGLKTCESILGAGYLGTLGCTADCTVSVTGCYSPVCGNGVLEGSEQCDDGNVLSGDGCSLVCVSEVPVEIIHLDAKSGFQIARGSCQQVATGAVNLVNSLFGRSPTLPAVMCAKNLANGDLLEFTTIEFSSENDALRTMTFDVAADGLYCSYCTDADGDGYGVGDTRKCVNTAPDCDDNNAAVHPGETELCDAALVDENCNGAQNEGCLCNAGDSRNCGPDTETGECTFGTQDCSINGVWSTCAGEVMPSIEVCDKLDNNCDGTVDEGVTHAYYRDADADGYGDSNVNIQECVVSSGYAANSGDCDDTSASINPNAVEICNNLDDNCNDIVDDNLVRGCSANYLGTCAIGSEVCNAGLWTGCPTPANETCPDNSADNNCDGVVVTNCAVCDADGDGYRSLSSDLALCAGYPASLDCNDDNSAIHPEVIESCNGIDDNCNGIVDDGFDMDEDGYTICNGDCNDNNALINTGAMEICNNLDDNCNGFIDEGVKNTYYRDADGDGYGDVLVSLQACSAPAGYVENSRDCDDNVAAIHPENMEIPCDGIDNDCSGADFEGTDADHDGFKIEDGLCGLIDCDDNNANVNPNAAETCDGVDNNCDENIDSADSGLVLDLCDKQAGVCANSQHTAAQCVAGGWESCDASNYGSLYNVQETCPDDEVDNNCDGVNTFACAAVCDKDGDGYKPDDAPWYCLWPFYSAGDCNDNDALVYPGAKETCDGVNNDCSISTEDGSGEDWFGQTTTCGVGACGSTGVLTCQAGNQVSTCEAGTPTTEVCNGRDDNCDGVVDENLGTATCGLGICTHTIPNCVNGVPQVCNPLQGVRLETCNGLDDDCDGITDNKVDADKDGVNDCSADQCLGSVADNIALNPNQYAQNILTTSAFESGARNDQSLVFNMVNAKGCTCKQIVTKLGLGLGQVKKGCSPGVMQQWTGFAEVIDRNAGIGKA